MGREVREGDYEVLGRGKMVREDGVGRGKLLFGDLIGRWDYSLGRDWMGDYEVLGRGRMGREDGEGGWDWKEGL